MANPSPFNPLGSRNPYGLIGPGLAILCALTMVLGLTGTDGGPVAWVAAFCVAFGGGVLLGRWFRSRRRRSEALLDAVLAEPSPTPSVLLEKDDADAPATTWDWDPDGGDDSFKDAALFLQELKEADDPVDLLAELVRTYYPMDVEAVDFHSPAVDPVIFCLACDLAQVDRRWRSEAGELDESPVASGLQCAAGCRVVGVDQSRMVAVVPLAQELTYGDHLRFLSMENALNRALFTLDGEADGALVGTGPDGLPTFRDHVRFQRSVESSICAQVASFENRTPDERGEWAVRHAIALGLSAFRLPHRLEATYRVNVAAGLVGFKVSMVPAAAMAPWTWSDAEGAPVVADGLARERAAAAYGARTLLMLAAFTFRVAPAIDEVWLNLVDEDALHVHTMASVKLHRRDLEDRDMARLGDPVALLKRLGATLDEHRGTLGPVEALFSMDDEELCPSRRFASPELSSRPLDPRAQKALGAHTLADLSIREDGRRRRVVEELGRDLDGSCADNVGLLLDLAETDPDPAMAEAARRAAARLIEGTIDDDDHFALMDELMAGDGLDRLVDGAARALAAQGSGDAVEALSQHLADLDRAGRYEDTDGVCYRAFGSYVDRAIFNRLGDGGGRKVSLVPAAYVRAHLMLSTVDLDREDAPAALLHGLRAAEVAPLDTAARLRITRCYEMMGDLPMACATLEELLALVHDPESIALAYYRLAFLLWKQGDLTEADACYRRSLGYPSTYAPLAQLELLALESSGEVEPVAEGDVEEVLRAAQIPVAPTDAVSQVLLDCARASVDAEIFPLARDATALVGMLSGDGAILDLLNSLESDPDRPVDNGAPDGPVPDKLP